MSLLGVDGGDGSGLAEVARGKPEFAGWDPSSVFGGSSAAMPQEGAGGLAAQFADGGGFQADEEENAEYDIADVFAMQDHERGGGQPHGAEAPAFDGDGHEQGSSWEPQRNNGALPFPSQTDDFQYRPELQPQLAPEPEPRGQPDPEPHGEPEPEPDAKPQPQERPDAGDNDGEVWPSPRADGQDLMLDGMLPSLHASPSEANDPADTARVESTLHTFQQPWQQALPVHERDVTSLPVPAAREGNDDVASVAPTVAATNQGVPPSSTQEDDPLMKEKRRKSLDSLRKRRQSSYKARPDIPNQVDDEVPEAQHMRVNSDEVASSQGEQHGALDAGDESDDLSAQADIDEPMVFRARAAQHRQNDNGSSTAHASTSYMEQVDRTQVEDTTRQEHDAAALNVQRAFRGHRARKTSSILRDQRYLLRTEENSAAVTLQRVARGHQARRYANHLAMKQERRRVLRDQVAAALEADDDDIDGEELAAADTPRDHGEAQQTRSVDHRENGHDSGPSDDGNHQAPGGEDGVEEQDCGQESDEEDIMVFSAKADRIPRATRASVQSSDVLVDPALPPQQPIPPQNENQLQVAETDEAKDPGRETPSATAVPTRGQAVHVSTADPTPHEHPNPRRASAHRCDASVSSTPATHARGINVAEQQRRAAAAQLMQRVWRGHRGRVIARKRKRLWENQFKCRNCGRVQQAGVYCKGCGHRKPKASSRTSQQAQQRQQAQQQQQQQQQPQHTEQQQRRRRRERSSSYEGGRAAGVVANAAGSRLPKIGLSRHETDHEGPSQPNVRGPNDHPHKDRKRAEALSGRREARRQSQEGAMGRPPVAPAAGGVSADARLNQKQQNPQQQQQQQQQKQQQRARVRRTVSARESMQRSIESENGAPPVADDSVSLPPLPVAAAGAGARRRARGEAREPGTNKPPALRSRIPRYSNDDSLNSSTNFGRAAAAGGAVPRQTAQSAPPGDGSSPTNMPSRANPHTPPSVNGAIRSDRASRPAPNLIGGRRDVGGGDVGVGGGGGGGGGGSYLRLFEDQQKKQGPRQARRRR